MVGKLVTELAAVPGAIAVVLGGSRATGTSRPDSDWDLGLYYRASQRAFDPDAVRRLGYEGFVSRLGEWGPIQNGGAWLRIGDQSVDVLFRDLDAVERWLDQASHGQFAIHLQSGYLVGAPTYLPVGELALCQPLAGGTMPRPEFPAALAETAGQYWYWQARTSLLFATGHARAGDVVCCAGLLTQAILQAAHSRLALRKEWVLNEKRLVARAGLEEVQGLIARAGGTADELTATVRAVSDALHIEPLRRGANEG